MSEFDFDAAIKAAQDAIDIETAIHDQRMEFWSGYKCAMEEAQRHLGGYA